MIICITSTQQTYYVKLERQQEAQKVIDYFQNS